MGRRGDQITSAVRIFVMVESSQDNVMANEGSIANIKSSLILNFASAVKKYIFSDKQVLATVCKKGRKYA